MKYFALLFLLIFFTGCGQQYYRKTTYSASVQENEVYRKEVIKPL